MALNSLEFMHLKETVVGILLALESAIDNYFRSLETETVECVMSPFELEGDSYKFDFTAGRQETPFYSRPRLELLEM